MKPTTNPLPSLASFLLSVGACEDAIEWSEPYGENWERAWRQCPRGDWLIWVAAECLTNRRQVVAAACACVRKVLPLLPTKSAARQAFDLAKSWADGKSVSAGKLRKMEEKACVEAAGEECVKTFDAMYACLDLAGGVSESNWRCSYGLSLAVSEATDALADGSYKRSELVRKKELAAFARLVRRRIAYADVQAAALRRSRG